MGKLQSLHTYVSALNRSLWCFESQPNVLVPSSPSFADFGALRPLSFLIDEDVWLLLIGALRLDSQFSRHDCGSVVAFLGVVEVRGGMLVGAPRAR